MRLNGNLFNFRNYNSLNQSSLVSRLFGNRNVGRQSMTARNIANRNMAPNFKDGVVYSRGNRNASKLYTRRGTLAGARQGRRPSQRRPFYSGQEMLNVLKQYEGNSYILGYDGKTAYFQGMEDVYRYSSTSRYSVESRLVGEKIYFNPADVNEALGIHNPKQMSVKDNEVSFDSYSYYQFKGKDGRNHRVLSMGSSLRADTFADFDNYTYDKEAVEYAEFWEDVAHGNVWSIEQRYSQKEIRQKLTDAGIQNGFFTVTVGNRSQSYYLSSNEDAMTLFDKETYDKRYNALVSGKTFQLDKFQPGQTVTVGGKEYVLNENKGIDIEYGAEVY